MGFKTHHTTFERACVPLGAGGDTLSAFFMREIFVILLLQIKNSMDFSPFLQKAQNDKNASSLRAVFAKTARQSINLDANLPLDCHEFARLRFANSRNDKFLVILINSFALT